MPLGTKTITVKGSTLDAPGWKRLSGHGPRLAPGSQYRKAWKEQTSNKKRIIKSSILKNTIWRTYAEKYKTNSMI